jgi:tRNA(Arg) A34 adenosine deaminase TadA
MLLVAVDPCHMCYMMMQWMEDDPDLTAPQLW